MIKFDMTKPPGRRGSMMPVWRGRNRERCGGWFDEVEPLHAHEDAALKWMHCAVGEALRLDEVDYRGNVHDLDPDDQPYPMADCYESDLAYGLREAYPPLEVLGGEFWGCVKRDDVTRAKSELNKIARFISRCGGPETVRENVIRQAKLRFEAKSALERTTREAGD